MLACGGNFIPFVSSFSKWTDEEIEMLRHAVLKFGEELSQICDHIKGKVV